MVDPSQGIDESFDLLVENGRIAQIGKSLKLPVGAEEFSAENLVVCPGLIDLQVHFREPGREDRETLETGSRAALIGGVTTAVAMPNVTPVADNQTVIDFIVQKSRELNLINILPTGSITQGQSGERLSEMAELKSHGAVAVTDDGVDVQNEGLLRRALEYARTQDLLLMSHCEVNDLTEGGVMHEGWISTELGLPGVPTATEDLAVYKNLMLAEMTQARLHLLHLSSAGAVELVRQAKSRAGEKISAEVCVQHLFFTDESCRGYNVNAKMYPPIRSEEHRQALIAGLKDNTLQAITTDHAPHIPSDKLQPFSEAAFGTTGLETSFAAAHTALVQAKHLSLSQLISKLTIEPAKIIGSDRGTLQKGAVADITFIDPQAVWRYDVNQTQSKGKNSLFDGEELTGRVQHVLFGGAWRVQNCELVV